MRAQISAEFFVAFAAVAAVVLISVLIYGAQLTNLLQSKDALSAKKTAYQLSAAINSVYLAGNGTNAIILVMPNNESITISGNNLVVQKNKEKVSISLLTDRINSSSIQSGYRKIKNNAGLIEIE